MTIDFSTWGSVTDGQRFAIPDSPLTQQASNIYLFGEGDGDESSDAEGDKTASLTEILWIDGDGQDDFHVEVETTDTIIQIPQIFSDEEEFFVSFWVKTPDERDSERVLSQNGVNGANIWMGDDAWGWAVGGDIVDSENRPNLNEDVWSMVTITRDSDGEGTVYVHEVETGLADSGSENTSNPDWGDNDTNLLRQIDDTSGSTSALPETKMDFAVFGKSHVSQSDVDDHYDSTVDNYT